MGRIRSPYPDICGLSLAMRLYSDLNRLSDRSAVTESHYIEELGKQLFIDRVIGETSRNQILKLLGKPYQKDRDNAEGLDVGILNKLAERVVNLLPAYKAKPPQLEQDNWWSFFLQNVAAVPSELQDFNQFAYYRYLKPEQKNQVDIFVEGKLMTLGTDPDIQHYLVFFWGTLGLGVRSALMQVNKRTGDVTYNYYHQSEKSDQTWTPNVTFKTDKSSGGAFIPGKNMCVIDLVEPKSDPKHEYMRLVMFLKTKGDFHSGGEFKGELLIYSSDVLVPDACEVFVKRYETLESAQKVIKEGVPPEIEFELLNRRVSSNSIQTLVENRTLRSEPIYELVDILKGAYLFITEPSDPDHKDKGEFVIGAAYFKNSGYVDLRVAHHRKVIANYIENVEMLGDNIIRLNPLSENESLKLTFYLKASYTSTHSETKVTHLTGKCLGINNGLIYGSNVIFMPISEIGEIELNEDTKTELDYVVKMQADNINYFTEEKLNDLADTDIKKQLKDKYNNYK
jgi:hypothetical protein